MRRALLFTALLAAACSSGPAHPRPPGPGSAPDAAPPPPAVTSPTERECEALIAHAIALRTSELQRTLPPEQVPTAAEQAALATELRGAFLADCRAGTRRGYDCAITAATLADLAGCQGAPQSVPEAP